MLTTDGAGAGGRGGGDDLRHLSLVSGERTRGEFDRLVRRLRAAGYVGERENVGDDFMCLCPIHENKGKHAPSLHVTRWADGAARVWCAGECSDARVYSEIMADDAILPTCRATKVSGSGDGGILISSLEVVSEKMYADWCLQEAEGRVNEAGVYIYRDEHGREILAKTKWTSKDFKWYRREGDGWRRGLEGRTVPLYRVDEIRDRLLENPDELVWAVEGEKDADRLWDEGLVATSSLFEKKTNDSGVHPPFMVLEGARVIVIPDRDRAGSGKANLFAHQARKVTPHVLVMGPLGDDSSPHGYDVSDWLDAGGTVRELLWLAETSETSGDDDGDGVGGDDGGDGGSGPVTDDVLESGSADWVDLPVDAEEFERIVLKQQLSIRSRLEAKRREEIGLWTAPPEEALGTLAAALVRPQVEREYFIEGLLVKGHNVTVLGQFKSGKTTLMCNLTQALVEGGEFLGSFDVAASALQGRVGLWNAEMDERDYVDYLRGMGITERGAQRVALANLRSYSVPLLTDVGMDWTVRWLRQMEVQVWIPDPWSKLCSWSKVEENSNSEVRQLLDRIEEIGREAGVEAIVVPMHPGRAEQDEGAERARGATVVDDWPDARWVYTRQDPLRFLKAEGRGVRLEESGIEFDSGSGRLRMIGGSRAEARESRGSAEVVQILTESPGMPKTELRAELKIATNCSTNGIVDSMIKQALYAGLIHEVKDGRTKLMYPGPDEAAERQKEIAQTWLASQSAGA